MIEKSEFEFKLLDYNGILPEEHILNTTQNGAGFTAYIEREIQVDHSNNKHINGSGFRIAAMNKDELAGCISVGLKHPQTKAAYYEFFIVKNKYRDTDLAIQLLGYAENILKEKGTLFVSGIVKHNDAGYYEDFKKAGFYNVKAISAEKEKEPVICFEKSFFKTNFFRNISRLGILGGMGSNTSAKFLLEICKLTSQTENEQDQLPVILNSAPDIPDRTELIFKNQTDRLQSILDDQLKQLSHFNISHIVICCFTFHAVLDQIDPVMREKVVSLVDYTVNLLKHKQGTYLVLGTNGSYQLKLLKNASNIIYPLEDHQHKIHELIYQLKKGMPGKMIFPELRSIVDHYPCEGIVVSCTDLYPLIEAFNASLDGKEVINPLKIMTHDIIENWKISTANQARQAG